MGHLNLRTFGRVFVGFIRVNQTPFFCCAKRRVSESIAGVMY